MKNKKWGKKITALGSCFLFFLNLLNSSQFIPSAWAADRLNFNERNLIPESTASDADISRPTGTPHIDWMNGTNSLSATEHNDLPVKDAVQKQFLGFNAESIHIEKVKRFEAESDLADGTVLPENYKAQNVVTVKLGRSGPSLNYIEGQNSDGAPQVIATSGAANYLNLFPSSKSRGQVLYKVSQEYPGLTAEILPARRFEEKDLNEIELPKGFFAANVIEVKLSDGSTAVYFGGADTEHVYYPSLVLNAKDLKKTQLPILNSGTDTSMLETPIQTGSTPKSEIVSEAHTAPEAVVEIGTVIDREESAAPHLSIAESNIETETQSNPIETEANAEPKTGSVPSEDSPIFSVSQTEPLLIRPASGAEEVSENPPPGGGTIEDLPGTIGYHDTLLKLASFPEGVIDAGDYGKLEMSKRRIRLTRVGLGTDEALNLDTGELTRRSGAVTTVIDVNGRGTYLETLEDFSAAVSAAVRYRTTESGYQEGMAERVSSIFGSLYQLSEEWIRKYVSVPQSVGPGVPYLKPLEEIPEQYREQVRQIRLDEARIAEENRVREEARIQAENRAREEARIAEENRVREEAEARASEESHSKEPSKLSLNAFDEFGKALGVIDLTQSNGSILSETGEPTGTYSAQRINPEPGGSEHFLVQAQLHGENHFLISTADLPVHLTTFASAPIDTPSLDLAQYIPAVIKFLDLPTELPTADYDAIAKIAGDHPPLMESVTIFYLTQYLQKISRSGQVYTDVRPPKGFAPILKIFNQNLNDGERGEVIKAVAAIWDNLSLYAKGKFIGTFLQASNTNVDQSADLIASFFKEVNGNQNEANYLEEEMNFPIHKIFNNPDFGGPRREEMISLMLDKFKKFPQLITQFSNGLNGINSHEVTRRVTEAWKDLSIPAKGALIRMLVETSDPNVNQTANFVVSFLKAIDTSPNEFNDLQAVGSIDPILNHLDLDGQRREEIISLMLDKFKKYPKLSENQAFDFIKANIVSKDGLFVHLIDYKDRIINFASQVIETVSEAAGKAAKFMADTFSSWMNSAMDTTLNAYVSGVLISDYQKALTGDQEDLSYQIQQLIHATNWNLNAANREAIHTALSASDFSSWSAGAMVLFLDDATLPRWTVDSAIKDKFYTAAVNSLQTDDNVSKIKSRFDTIVHEKHTAADSTLAVLSHLISFMKRNSDFKTYHSLLTPLLLKLNPRQEKEKAVDYKKRIDAITKIWDESRIFLLHPTGKGDPAFLTVISDYAAHHQDWVDVMTLDEDIIDRGVQAWGLQHDDVVSMSIKVNDQWGLEESSDVLSHEGIHAWELSNKIHPIVNFIADAWYAKTDLSKYASFDWGTYEKPKQNPEFVSQYATTNALEYLAETYSYWHWDSAVELKRAIDNYFQGFKMKLNVFMAIWNYGVPKPSTSSATFPLTTLNKTSGLIETEQIPAFWESGDMADGVFSFTLPDSNTTYRVIFKDGHIIDLQSPTA